MAKLSLINRDEKRRALVKKYAKKRLMLVAIIMIIIPLPTWLVDVLIAINISVSMLVLLVVFYIARPVEFSSFPSVILIATLFRLAITITTSRLILLQADAGEKPGLLGVRRYLGVVPPQGQVHQAWIDQVEAGEEAGDLLA